MPMLCPGCGAPLRVPSFAPIPSRPVNPVEALKTEPGFHTAGVVAMGVVVVTFAGGFFSHLMFLSWLVGGSIGAVLAAGAMVRLPGRDGALVGRNWARAALLFALLELAIPFVAGIVAVRWMSDQIAELQSTYR
ncbi:MAG: hypothetical protein K8T20_15910 [Planctomycetes bacterium]|nr:hypothetical protein [Planctomycetota bacterium]